MRVPTAGETADSVQRAQRALAEITARQADEARDLAEQRAQQLTRWHSDDQATEQEHDRAIDRDAVTVGGPDGFSDHE